MQTFPSSLAQRLTNIHIGYLSLMPAIATIAIIGVFDLVKYLLLFFVVGTAAVGIYLAVTASYTKTAPNAFQAVVMIFDGPLWAIAAMFFGGSWATLVVDDVLIETTGILLGILGVTLVSRVPTREQRVKSLIAVGLPLLGVLGVVWLYGQDYLFPYPERCLAVALGALQSAVINFRLAANDSVQRSAEGFILFGIIAWIASIFIGFGINALTSS